jgi:hypothetical protein
MFPDRNSHKYAWPSPDGKPQYQIGHILIRQAKAFKCTWCHSGQHIDTDNSVSVADVRERLSMNKQRLYRFHMERPNLKKVNKVRVVLCWGLK